MGQDGLLGSRGCILVLKGGRWPGRSREQGISGIAKGMCKTSVWLGFEFTENIKKQGRRVKRGPPGALKGCESLHLVLRCWWDRSSPHMGSMVRQDLSVVGMELCEGSGEQVLPGGVGVGGGMGVCGALRGGCMELG